MLSALFSPPRPYRAAGLAFLLSVLLVVTLRSLAPVAISFDQGIQILAAERFLTGQGLTTPTNWGDELSLEPNVLDISQPRRIQPHTVWPLGHSMQIALGLKAGLSLATSLKLLHLALTLIGWSGWWLMALPLLRQHPEPSFLRRLVVLVPSLALPLLFTPLWINLDAILWAAAPWLFFALARGSEEPQGNIRWHFLAGGIAGFAYAFRYASIALVLTSILLYLFAAMGGTKRWLRPPLFFALGCLIAASPAILFNYFSGQSFTIPSALVETLHPPVQQILFHKIFPNLFCTLRPLLFWLPEQYVKPLLHSPALLPARALLAILFFATPWVICHGRRFSGWLAIREPIAAACWLLPSIILINSAFTYVHHGIYLTAGRYYIACEPAAFLSWCLLACLPKPARFWERLVQRLTQGLLLLVLFAFSVRLLYLALPKKVGSQLACVIGRSLTLPEPIPSNAITNQQAPHKIALFALLAQNRGSIAYTEDYGNYAYDRSILEDRVRRIQDPVYWQSAYTSQPITIFWLCPITPLNSEESKLVLGTEDEAFEAIPGFHQLQVVARFPEQGKIIYRSDLPAGFHFRAKP